MNSISLHRVPKYWCFHFLGSSNRPSIDEGRLGLKFQIVDDDQLLTKTLMRESTKFAEGTRTFENNQNFVCYIRNFMLKI
ncbi:hypothetical protein D3F03_11240 [Simplicispira hankyongi]|uniref:Uncharacterized protein n=1 Tax=Simplicispira hankyongi TaxID=2315688 RepID=A0A398C492_9BURK|nr:hypothetical protein D3F03_11240 [Simplicispira hankyongi]